jgi:RNA-directed DNA polymerase
MPQAQAATAEVGEGRARAKGNPGQPSRGRTQGRAALSRARDRGRQAAKERGKRLTALGPQVSSIDRLREGYPSRKHQAAPGVDGPTWATSGAQLETNLRDLADRRQRGADHAPPVAPVYRPQAAGRPRPSGKPPLEDQIVQRATVEGLNAVDAQACRGFSYGARPGRSPHHALEAVTVGREKRHSPWGLAADMRGFDEAIDHAWWVKCIEHRLGDQRGVRHIRQGLKAGVREEGHWRPQDAGPPQGGRARPLLATLSLHEVLDLWAAQWRRRHARGEVSIVRYCDDCSVGFQPQDAAEQFRSDLRDRFARCYLERHPAKTRLMAFGRGASERRQRRRQGKPAPFDFLGFTPLWSQTRTGKCTGRRQTVAKRLRKKWQEIKQTLRERRHWPLRQLGAWRKRGLTGPDR